jgi:hypothetical protein
MATPYTATQPSNLETSRGDWQEARNGTQEPSNFRSVTPAMNNTRGAVRNASPAAGRVPGGPASNVEAHYGTRSTTPSGRYLGSYNTPEGTQTQPPQNAASTPTSAGLIRLPLRKPMGIVFEPMYDPNNPSLQRGVRICDLPRTGAAALSRKLEIGDELLSINDKTMSRLSFDEIMDFIIEADPEQVNLLFRRPRKETLNARHGIKTPSATPSGPGVKWVDDEARKRKEDGKKKREPSSSKKDKKPPRRPKTRDDDETAQSEDDNRAKRKKTRRKDPYESESFLDILIDTICANPDSVCRDRRRGGDDDDYYSDEDDGTFASRDDSTYVTYESEDQQKKKKKENIKSKGQNRDDDSSTYGETEDDTLEDKAKKSREKDGKRLSPPKESKRTPAAEPPKKHEKYEDDGTLETVESQERPKPIVLQPEQAPPLGLAPNPQPAGPVSTLDTDDEVNNKAPIKEFEYDELGDHGADVSVMESLGGPSLLIEKQRQAAIMAKTIPAPPVAQEIIANFGKDYPLDFGFSREQTIQNDPLRFYTFVVKGLLQEHEPEKVRLLDKLLAKYKGREDHLVQKLSVRYTKEGEGEGQDDDNFEEAVNKGKDSAHANAAIQTARERLQNDFSPAEWPEKETKEQEQEDEQPPQQEGGSDSNSDFSSDSIDGTSPAVIAQVSELLNYVYGKTSVPGQIDRVSTIMRAYEGREAVLLELLETKALIKANREKENAGNLPSFLRNSANAQRDLEKDMPGESDVPPVTPMATQPPAAINDDISSMSGVSTPAVEAQQTTAGVLKQISVSKSWKSQFQLSVHFRNSPACLIFSKLTKLPTQPRLQIPRRLAKLPLQLRHQ